MLIPYFWKWINSIYLLYSKFSSCIDIRISPESSLMINEFVRFAFDVFLAFTPVVEACGVRAEANELIFSVYCFGVDLGETRIVLYLYRNTIQTGRTYS